jgi:hypothetical protein
MYRITVCYGLGNGKLHPDGSATFDYVVSAKGLEREQTDLERWLRQIAIKSSD